MSEKNSSPDVQTEFEQPESTTPSQTPEQVVSKEECLQSLEQIIESNLKTFYQVGMALKEIRDKNLYKLQGYHNFKDYCVERWDMGSRYAYMQMESSTVVENLRTTGSLFLPTSERQVRPLTKLEPQQQRQAWEKIIEIAQSRDTKPKVTAKLVEKVVSEVTGKAKGKGRNSKPVDEKIVYKVPIDIDTNESLKKSFYQICNLLDKHGVAVSKEIVIEALLQVALQELEEKGEESLVVAKVASRLLN